MMSLSPATRLLACLCIAILATFTSPSISGGQPIAGDKAPPLTLKALLQAPDGASADWGDLEGKVIIVDFWATWCAPCIASIPHLNDLAEQFKDEDVQFISITNEDRGVVEAFLKKREMRGWIGLDTDSATQTAYGVSGIPHTFVIGADGQILGDTHPQKLTAEHIEKALKGEEIGLGRNRDIKVVPAQERVASYGRSYLPGDFPGVGFDSNPLPQPLAQLIVRPALNPEGGSYSGTGPNRATWIAADPASVVQQAYGRAYGIPSSRVDVKAEMPEEKLDVAIWAPPGDESLFRHFVEAGLGSALELEAREEEREVEVLVLKATDDAQDKLSPTASTGGSSTSSRQEEGRLIVNGINMQPAALGALIEHILKRPVIDETGLSGGYDIEVAIRDDLKSLQTELEKLGLRLEPEQRTLTYLVIENRGD